MHRRVAVLVLCLCVGLSVCPFVCLSVTTLASSLFVSTVQVRYIGQSFINFNSWIFEKNLKSYGVKKPI